MVILSRNDNQNSDNIGNKRCCIDEPDTGDGEPGESLLRMIKADLPQLIELDRDVELNQIKLFHQ